MVTTTDVLRFRVPVPPSKKNSQQIRRKRGRPFVTSSDDAKRAEESIRAHVLTLIGPRREALFGDDDVAAAIAYHARLGMIDVELRSLGPRPKGFTGRRRDVHNIPEALLDALQGLVYEDDNQVAKLTVWRALD